MKILILSSQVNKYHLNKTFTKVSHEKADRQNTC